MSKIHIPMTTFVDFVVANGTSRVTVVKTAKARYQDVYDLNHDFYNSLRKSIVAAAQKNLNSRATLDAIRSALGNRHVRKSKVYEACIAGYKKWQGRKTIVWRHELGSKSPGWTRGRLVIRVKPELRVSINDRPHIIKLYFDEDQPSKQRLATMLHLLKQSDHAEQPQVIFGILDMRRGRYYRPTREVPDLEQLLVSEVAAFETMWDNV